MKNSKKYVSAFPLMDLLLTDKHEDILSPQELDETSIMGSMPAPESDDDVLEMAHMMGLYEDSDYEHPKEVNLAKEIDKDEEYARSH